MLDTQVFEVLADPTRRRIVDELRSGERAVGQLVEKMHIGQPGVSKQLRVLHLAGFVAVRPDRQRRLYSLRPEPFQKLDAWMQSYRDLWEGRFDRLEAQLAARRNRRENATAPSRPPGTKRSESN